MPSRGSSREGGGSRGSKHMWGDKSRGQGRAEAPGLAARGMRGESWSPPDPAGVSASGPGLGPSQGQPTHLASPDSSLALWHPASGGRPTSPAPRGGRAAQKATPVQESTRLQRELRDPRVQHGGSGSFPRSVSTLSSGFCSWSSVTHWDPEAEALAHTALWYRCAGALPQQEGALPASWCC